MCTSTASNVQAHLVSEHARIGTLPRHFGTLMMALEGRVYDFMREFAGSYHGGIWQFFELSNGGFFMSPPEGEYQLVIASNGFEGRLSADAAGITVCLFAFSHLSFEYQTELFADHYHWLRDFAIHHAEAGLIFAAID